MAQALCPRCQHGVTVPDCLSFGLLRCPSCLEAYKFQPGDEPADSAASSANILSDILAEPPRTPPAAAAEPPAPTPTPTAPPATAGPTMLAPHICQHCMCQIHTPINKKAASPNCPKCRNRTSIYALQFQCPHCRELLECPRRLGGQSRPCPKCTRDIAIPKLVLEAEADGADDLEAFVCECPSCSKRVVARRDEVGRPGICPMCLVIITVPSYGTVSRKAPVEEAAPRETSQGDRQVMCGACGLHIPATARNCPICGKANQVSKYP